MYNNGISSLGVTSCIYYNFIFHFVCGVCIASTSTKPYCTIAPVLLYYWKRHYCGTYRQRLRFPVAHACVSIFKS